MNWTDFKTAVAQAVVTSNTSPVVVTVPSTSGSGEKFEIATVSKDGHITAKRVKE